MEHARTQLRPHSSSPCVIMHIDADAFFASCEQAVNPALRGKPVVTGRERGIASAVSYEAKARGVKRGMLIRDIVRMCPEVVYLPSDYETYSLFSERMFAIVRRYTNRVEEYSIDECFAELPECNQSPASSPADIARHIQQELVYDLGMTFSVGLASTKVLAKLASKRNKPRGFLEISSENIQQVLMTTPIGEVWGVGTRTTMHLGHFGIKTAYDFVLRDEAWVRSTCAKPYVEVWQELRGVSVLPVCRGAKHTYQSIGKTKTFTPPTSDCALLLARLSKNIENACIKARRHGLVAKRVQVFLRTRDFRHVACEFRLPYKTAYPNQIMSLVRAHFSEMYVNRALYRATGVVLLDLEIPGPEQGDLFGMHQEAGRFRAVYAVVDAMDCAFGKHTVHLGSSLFALNTPNHVGDRSIEKQSTVNQCLGEGKRRRLGIPSLGEVC